MPYNFFDRQAELGALERSWGKGGGQLVLVWGRRRTGKTRLLGRFIEGKRAVFYGATQQAAETELRALSETVRSAFPPRGDDLLAHADFPDWGAALSYFARKAERQRLILVLDEFPYLVESEPALPSIVQKFWDHEGRQSKLHLVLCGSAQAVMEELQRERAPLFGRVDVRLQLKPFGYRDAALFVPGLSPVEKAISYGVLGGMPTYLARWDDKLGHRANLRRLFADPASPLIEEGEFVLSNELPEGSGYFRILHAIASGHRTFGKIKTFADIDISRQLDNLVELHLVERVVPVTEDPTKTKRAVYRIADNFLAFWFRFVYRHRADIARGLGRDIVDGVILPGLSDYMGEPWEEMCREFVRDQAQRGRLPVAVSSVGRWWNTDNSVEIDIVGRHGNTVVLVSSVKWSKAIGKRDLVELRRAAEHLPERSPHIVDVLFNRERREEAAVPTTVYSAEDLYAE